MVASLVIADLCTVIGFGILSFSAIPVLHGIGLTVAIGACLSLLFGAILSARPRRMVGHCAGELLNGRHDGSANDGEPADGTVAGDRSGSPAAGLLARWRPSMGLPGCVHAYYRRAAHRV